MATIQGIVGATTYPAKTSVQATKPRLSIGRRPIRSDIHPARIIKGNSDVDAKDHSALMVDWLYPRPLTI
jgi:hypothetical protein